MQKLIRLLIIYTASVTTILLIITFTSIRGTAEQNKKAESAINNLKQELGKIAAYQQSQKETDQKVDSLKPETTNTVGTKVLGSSKEASDSSKILSGFVTINDKKWQSVDVYESNSYSSKVIGKIEFDKVYRYLKKEGSWYQIVLPKTETNGWVAGRFLKEVADSGPKE
ncbi:MAG: SH3 domain-containing protein [Candidatus Daviesbacteria bacterium]|nr:SH3 domain-containing protein [Candidatus Daviesbacteria bacterium]